MDLAVRWLERCSADSVERRPGKTGIRYRVKYRIRGAGTTKHYGGSFKTMTKATARNMWIACELAALRVPDFSILSEPVPPSRSLWLPS